MSPQRRKELESKIEKLRSQTRLVGQFEGVTLMRDGSDFLVKFGSRAEREYHLSVEDEKAAKSASKARDTLQRATALLETLQNHLRDEALHPLPINLDSTHLELIDALNGARRDVNSIKAVYAKYTHHREFFASVKLAESILSEMPECLLKTRYSQILRGLQQLFWNAIDGKHVEEASADLERSIEDFRNWKAAHEMEVNQATLEAARRAEFAAAESERHRALTEKRRLDLLEAKRLLSEAEARAKAEGLEEARRRQIERQKRLDRLKPRLAVERSARVEVVEIEPENTAAVYFIESCYSHFQSQLRRFSRVYHGIRFFLRVFLFIIILDHVPIYSNDGHCTPWTLDDRIRDVLRPVVVSELLIALLYFVAYLQPLYTVALQRIPIDIIQYWITVTLDLIPKFRHGSFVTGLCAKGKFHKLIKFGDAVDFVIASFVVGADRASASLFGTKPRVTDVVNLFAGINCMGRSLMVLGETLVRLAVVSSLRVDVAIFLSSEPLPPPPQCLEKFYRRMVFSSHQNLFRKIRKTRIPPRARVQLDFLIND